MLQGSQVKFLEYDPTHDPVVAKAAEKARKVYKRGNWPRLFFSEDKEGREGQGRPAVKRHLSKVLKGRIPWTYWADEEYEIPVILNAQSWDHEESGHSQTGLNELDSIVGKGHGFQTVKPLRLFKKIIQIWCPPTGLVLDPYAGSGTTGHAVLELNRETGSDRRFILIEQGRPDNGDKYARTLTWQRLKNAITGERPDKAGRLKKLAEPLEGGFEFGDFCISPRKGIFQHPTANVGVTGT